MTGFKNVYFKYYTTELLKSIFLAMWWKQNIIEICKLCLYIHISSLSLWKC